MFPSPSSGPPLLSASWSPPLSPGGVGRARVGAGGAGGGVARWWVVGGVAEGFAGAAGGFAGVAGGFGAVEAEWLTGAGVVGAVVPVGWPEEHPAATAASSVSPAAHRIRLDVIARPSCSRI
jgi:hypothetical protein